MGYTHFDKVSGVNGLAVGSKGSEKVIADELGRMYLNFAPGNIFYVDSGATGAADTNAGTTWATALATIDGAIGKCTASNGDVIFVAPGHTETITAAAGIVFDVAGVTVVGLGTGTLRPKISLTTATTSDIDVTAANVTIKNVVFEAGFADVAVCIDLDATDFTLEDCEFKDSAADKNFVVYIDCDDTANACDRLTVRNCQVFSPDTANDHFIACVGDIDRLTVENCFVSMGVADGEAIIEASTGKDFTNCLIRHNAFFRLNTANVVAMESDTTANSGMIYDNYVGTADSDAATPWDVTGARLFQNYQVGVVDASGLLLPAVDDNT